MYHACEFDEIPEIQTDMDDSVLPLTPRRVAVLRLEGRREALRHGKHEATKLPAQSVHLPPVWKCPRVRTKQGFDHGDFLDPDAIQKRAFPTKIHRLTDEWNHIKRLHEEARGIIRRTRDQLTRPKHYRDRSWTCDHLTEPQHCRDRSWTRDHPTEPHYRDRSWTRDQQTGQKHNMDRSQHIRPCTSGPNNRNQEVYSRRPPCYLPKLQNTGIPSNIDSVKLGGCKCPASFTHELLQKDSSKRRPSKSRETARFGRPSHFTKHYLIPALNTKFR